MLCWNSQPCRRFRPRQNARQHHNPEMNPNWQGVFPAVTTQLKQDQSLDLDATARHVDVLIESGVTGLIMLGSLGENQSLQAEEKRRVVEATAQAARGRVPVRSGVARRSTAE